MEIQSNYKPVDSNDNFTHLQDGLYGSARLSFIKKVYAILSAQLLFTVAMCFASYYSEPFLNFQIQQQWLMWVLLVFMIIAEIAIFCCPAGRQFPINMVCLFVFTFGQAYMISYICSIVAQDEGAAIVVVAACMTLAITISLTLYAMFTKTDFTVKWGIIIVILVAMLILGIVSIFAWTPFLDNLYCSLGVILFGIYIVMDTQLIIGGKTFKLSMDDYVVGALILYIDIIQMFLYILELLSKKK